MAIDFIQVAKTQSSATQAPLLLNYIAALRLAYELGVRTKAIMDHNQNGVSWTALETIFGVPTGKGQTVYNFVNGSVGAMVGTFQNADSKNLPETVGE